MNEPKPLRGQGPPSAAAAAAAAEDIRDATAVPAVLAVLACVVLWTLMPAVLLSAPHGDNVEQLNWSHSVQWGYFKHPPLPTWLLCAAIEVFGRSAELTYALAMACVGGALFGVWRCARMLMNVEAALTALLFSTANYYLMGRGSFLNHNTVMLPFVALSAWAVLRIVNGASWQVWLLLGLAQALGLLTKYQMGLVIGANGLALLAGGVHRQPGFGRHLALAAAATLLPLIPHILWLADHQFSSFQYASHSLLAQLSLPARAMAAAGFLGQQAARLAPAALAAALALALNAALRRRHAAAPATTVPVEPETGERVSRALAALGLAPLAGIVLLCLVLGVAPQNHWGASATLLLPLWAFDWARRSVRWTLPSAALATAALHLAAVAWNLAVWVLHPGPHHLFAARPLAALAQTHWAKHQTGDIPLLIGPDWESGSISIYLPGQPPVVPGGDWRQAPWVDQQRAKACGALVIGRPGTPLEEQIPALNGADLADRATLSWRNVRGRESSIQVGSIAPIPGARCH